MSFRFAIVDAYVRSTLECGGSTPPWSSSSALCQSGVEPPHSKVLRTAIFMRVAVSDTAAKDLGKSTGYVTKNVETPGPRRKPWGKREVEMFLQPRQGRRQHLEPGDPDIATTVAQSQLLRDMVPRLTQ